MATLFGKLRIFSLSNLHALLDKAIDMNSVGALEQYVRDLEDSQREMATATNVAGADMDIAAKEITNLKGQVSDTNANIELILGDGDASNDHLATPLAVRLEGYESDLKTKTDEYAALQANYEALSQASSTLETRHASMMQQLTRLRSTSRATAAKTKGATALENAAAAMSDSEGASVDSLTRRMDHDAAVADRRFKQATSTIQSAAGTDIAAIKAQKRIAEIRAKMAGTSGANATTTATQGGATGG